MKLIWKLGDEEEDFRHTRAGWLTVGGVHIHRELQLDVLRSVERCHEEKCDALLDFLETVGDCFEEESIRVAIKTSYLK